MNSDRGKAGDPVAVRIGPRVDRALAAVVIGFVLVVASGVFGRLVPTNESNAPAARPSQTLALAAPLIVTRPYDGVVHFRTTEIAVRGICRPGVDSVTATAYLRGRPIGEARIPVVDGRFAGIVPIIPPLVRATARLEVRAGDGAAPAVVEVSVPIEAGALILPRDASRLRATAGDALVVDVVTYAAVMEIRGLLTSDTGVLIAEGSTRLRLGTTTDLPRTVGVHIDIPGERLPSRARLHLIAFDEDGLEVEHVDSNVSLSNR